MCRTGLRSPLNRDLASIPSPVPVPPFDPKSEGFRLTLTPNNLRILSEDSSQDIREP